MKCFICNREDDLISFDRVYGDYGPCTTCAAVIQDCLDGYEDIPDVPVEEEWEPNKGCC